MAQPDLKLVMPTLEVEPGATTERSTPTRLPNAAYRSREYLTPTEMDAIVEAARKMRHGHRDATMLLSAIGTAFGRPKSATFVGARLTSTRRGLR